MADQTQKQKPTEEKAADPKGADAKDLSNKGEEIKSDMDDLLDEIDNVLEKNAEEFVKAYVQRGGE
jgi:ubiquitin-like protein Pup